ncbi:MAG TPA: hypothetical protein VK145_02170 [Candidatus Nanoarchaeia archaeon]|nr:hypothetical protein [Candidatus Nanoarchaeia archaeon]
MNETETKPIGNVSITSTQWAGSHGAGHITLGNLTTEEVQTVEGAVHGAQWIRVVNGRIVSHSCYEPLPDPIRDEEMHPFWRKPTAAERGDSETLFDTECRLNHSSPHFMIQHLGAYNNTPENYRRQAEKLESWGFEVMRSRRSREGKFWEIWYLPGAFLAKGELKEFIGNSRGKEETERALEFLRKNCEFGTLDLSVQRLATLVVD